MIDCLDLSKPCTQATFAELVGITQPTVSILVAEGKLPAEASVHTMLLAYCERLREQAAGRDSGLAAARTKLADAQREGIEIKNAVMRGQFAPIQHLAEVLATASQAVAQRFDHLPGRVAKACPGLPPVAMEQVMTVIAAARNDWVTETAELVVRAVTGVDDTPDGPQQEDAAHE